ncbi:hypothetical protein BDV93DRAFT_603064 [Ceratobasidium sp. AG-I]|nr:hypothetical protein BDV93DRAFT_603064 [Ceratobasidium sp. AG-I]
MPRNNVLHLRPVWSPLRRIAKPQLPPDPKVKKTAVLSPAVKSVYRTLLRATSASLLHHPTGTRCLRARFRPAFEEYLRVNWSNKAANRTTNEIQEWDTRIDNTLRFLQNSATSRGLPHQLTRNLSLLVNARALEQAHTSHPKWNPDRVVGKKSPTINPTASLTERIDAILEENLALAEGTARMLLGRV